jgi:ketosteroid isomerase-like protein
MLRKCLVKNKADVIKDFRSGNLKYESFKLDEVHVRVYGKTSVVTGLSMQKAHDKDQDISGQFYFTRVYVKQDGRWQIVANHQSRMAGAKE